MYKRQIVERLPAGRRLDRGEDGVEDFGRRLAGEARLSRQNQPVFKNRVGNLLNIVRRDKIPSGHCGPDLSRPIEGAGCPGAGSHLQHRMGPGGGGQLDDVPPDLLRDRDGGGLLLHCDDCAGVGYRLHRIKWDGVTEQAEHPQLLLGAGIAERKPHQETIHLGCRKTEGTFRFDRILGCLLYTSRCV